MLTTHKFPSRTEISELYENNPAIEFLSDYLEVLSILIEKYEEKAYPMPEATGIESLKFLMNQYELRQKDLVDIFKTPSILSEILNGKRKLTLEHVQKLSQRFGVRADTFI